MNNIFIREMISQSIIAYKKGEIPVGCIITKGNSIISRSYNLKHSSNISINHAEILSIKDCCNKLNSWDLSDCSLYVSLEPCIMCAGAIIESRIKNIYIGTANPYKGFFSSNYHKNFINLNIVWLNNKTCEFLINRTFKKLRKEL